MSKLNTPWSLDADAVRDNTGRIVVETINCGETFAEEIVKCVNGYADLEAERDALKAELKAACTVTFEAEMGECQGDESAVPFEEHAEAVRYAFDEAALVFGRVHDWHKQGGPDTETEWAESDAKARLDERRNANTTPVTLRNAGQGKPLHDEDPTV